MSALGVNGRRFAESFTWERAALETEAHLAQFVRQQAVPRSAPPGDDTPSVAGMASGA